MRIRERDLVDATSVFIDFIIKLYDKFQIEMPEEDFDPGVEVNRVYTCAIRNLVIKDMCGKRSEL